jgi:hypothetical protein
MAADDEYGERYDGARRQAELRDARCRGGGR